MLWLPAELSQVLNHLLGVRDDAIRTDVPQHPEIWDGLCGRYELPGRVTDVRARLMLGAGAQVFVREGQLVLRVLSPIPAALRGFTLHPDDEHDPYVFRLDLSAFGLTTARIVFSPEPITGATGVHLDLLPMSLRKRPASKSPSRWKTALLAALVAGTTAIAVRRRASRSHVD
jgi:hypothetical protein